MRYSTRNCQIGPLPLGVVVIQLLVMDQGIMSKDLNTERMRECCVAPRIVTQPGGQPGSNPRRGTINLVRNIRYPLKVG